MLSQQAVEEIVARALAEDAPWGDVTVDAVVPNGTTATAQVVAREPGVLAGVAAFETVFAQVGRGAVHVTWHLAEGQRFAAGAVLADVDGAAGPVLTGERVALNLLQRMSGIATLTAVYVQAVAGTRARIVDTRKTTPGLRVLERHAVICGGGHNHRHGLSDAVMVKDNHWALLTGAGLDITTALLGVRERIGHTVHIEVEVDRLDQVDAVLAARPDTIMLDNFSLADLRTGVERIGGACLVEASGGVSLETVADIARTGVDIISVGALTHSVRALDLGLDIDLAGPSTVAGLSRPAG